VARILYLRDRRLINSGRVLGGADRRRHARGVAASRAEQHGGGPPARASRLGFPGTPTHSPRSSRPDWRALSAAGHGEPGPRRVSLPGRIHVRSGLSRGRHGYDQVHGTVRGTEGTHRRRPLSNAIGEAPISPSIPVDQAWDSQASEPSSSNTVERSRCAAWRVRAQPVSWSGFRFPRRRLRSSAVADWSERDRNLCAIRRCVIVSPRKFRPDLVRGCCRRRVLVIDDNARLAESVRGSRHSR
jgi:hypothetical protein